MDILDITLARVGSPEGTGAALGIEVAAVDTPGTQALLEDKPAIGRRLEVLGPSSVGLMRIVDSDAGPIALPLRGSCEHQELGQVGPYHVELS